MCGIFGLVINKNSNFTRQTIKDICDNLFLYSATRGKESAGIAFHNGKNIKIIKKAGSPYSFIKDKKYENVFKESYFEFENENSISSCFSLIGHSRLVTNGFQYQDFNNQPVVTNEIVGIHNGIITNEQELWEKNKDLKRQFNVDTEIFLKLLNKNFSQTNDLEETSFKTFESIKGSASIASYFSKSNYLLLGTNTGSIFYIKDIDNKFFIFASERFILKKLAKSKPLKNKIKIQSISKLEALNGIKINLDNNYYSLFQIKENRIKSKSEPYSKRSILIKDYSSEKKDLKRCKICILPETYPYMDFDEKGVCRYCRKHKPFTTLGEEKLFSKIQSYKRKDGSPDCIVALSGGRDSCYGLHYVKKVLGLNPIAFTYDWGLVTPLARRNAAQICGQLGVEHIIRSPNISLKRKFVRKNVEAWLKRPELGMIPLFMAGDKAFYYFARELRKETGIDLVIFCTGNLMEHTPFKFGFSGIKDGESKNTLTGISSKDKLKLIYYYLKNFILNPSYLNESIIDTAFAYWHTFLKKDDFLYLYHYLKWDEDKIEKTIINEYDWEISSDTKSTWRIGDGTAAFYNYIYSTMAGFTENDDMLSNMIRENYLSREEALKLSNDFAEPRIPSIKEFTDMVGINFEETLSIINKAKKRY